MTTSTELAQLIEVTKLSAAAAIAGGMIAATGRAHSVEEAEKLLKDVVHSMYPQPGRVTYDMWKNEYKPDKKHT